MREKRGVTLVEVMVAIVIFTIVMVGGFVCFFYGRIHISHAYHQRMALEITKEKVEKCKAFGYNNVLTEPATSIPLGGIQFSRSLSVVEQTSNGTYKKLTVTTGWQDGGGSDSVQLITIIAKD